MVDGLFSVFSVRFSVLHFVLLVPGIVSAEQFHHYAPSNIENISPHP
jgi:hypothetical protein